VSKFLIGPHENRQKLVKLENFLPSYYKNKRNPIAKIERSGERGLKNSDENNQ
jgi:hypothetical protein